MKITEDPAAQVVVDAENPWPGLDYFVEENRAFFHGREAEANLLLTMVRHRILTVLYSQSGLGKSSLLQAGLFPRLRADGRLPVYIRLNLTDPEALAGEASLVGQTRQFIKDAIAAAIQSGQLASSTGSDGAGGGDAASLAPRDNESIWAYLHRRNPGLQTPSGEPLSLVLVFDQFEEIFTLGRDETHQAMRQAFLYDLADCVENRLPDQVLKEMDRQRKGSGSKYSDLDFNRQDYRVVLSLREDYLAELHDLSDLIPSIHENETRLLPLNGWQALDAVSIPGENLIEPVLAREIVEIVAASRRDDAEDSAGAAAAAVASNGELTDEAKLEVDPSLLSMVCRELNIERQRRKESKITQQIAEDLLKTSGRSILHRFYADCFQSLPDRTSAPEVQKFVEDELLTPSGYRNMVELVRAKRRLTNSGVPDPAAAFQKLTDQRLLRISERRQDKTKWIELTHDVLCDVVKESRVAREAREAKEREERAQREQAAQQLREAERQREEAETQAKRAQRREEEALARIKQMRRERSLGIAVLASLVCLAGVLFVAVYLGYDRYQTGKDAEKRGIALLGRAKDKLSQNDDPRRNVYALRLLGRCVRVAPAKEEAVKLLCNLLLSKNWCPPVSPLLTYSESPMFAANFSPNNREIVAVATDGNLVRWSATDFTRLPSIPLVPDKMKPENKGVLGSASFSKDARRILVTFFSPGQEFARLVTWSDEKSAYLAGHDQEIKVEFKYAIRSFAANREGNVLYVIPLRFDQSACHIFKLTDHTYKDTRTVPNTTAADLSPDDQWLATASTDGRVQLVDVNTLQQVEQTPILTRTLDAAEATQETRFFSLLFSDDGRELIGIASREPMRIWNTENGSANLIRPKSSTQQFLRADFAPPGRDGQWFAVGVTEMVGLWNIEKMDQLRAEPMCLPDPFVYPTVSADGKTLISLSGPVWAAQNTVRLWDVSLRKHAIDTSHMSFTGKNPPEWLSYVAEAVAGLRSNTEEEEEGRIQDLSKLKEKYAGTSFPKEYQPIWDRFLASDAK